MRALALRLFGHLSPRQATYRAMVAGFVTWVSLSLVPVWLWTTRREALIATGIAAVAVAIMSWRWRRESLDPLDPAWSRAGWKVVDEMVADDGNEDPIALRLWIDVMMNHPMRDTRAAADFIVDHHFADRPFGEVLDLIETAPPGPRAVLRALFRPPTEERPW